MVANVSSVSSLSRTSTDKSISIVPRLDHMLFNEKSRFISVAHRRNILGQYLFPGEIKIGRECAAKFGIWEFLLTNIMIRECPSIVGAVILPFRVFLSDQIL